MKGLSRKEGVVVDEGLLEGIELPTGGIRQPPDGGDRLSFTFNRQGRLPLM